MKPDLYPSTCGYRISNFLRPSTFGLRILFVVLCASASASSPLTLWYTQSAEKWVEALPIGNGRLGGMLFGGVNNEHLQFNDDTLWTGQPHEYQHEGAVKFLPTIREL